MRVIHEDNVPEVAVPGRFLRWIVGPSEGLASENCSCCIMRVEPGQTVSPAHCHPMGEELIYFLEGEGKVFVDGEIRSVRAGSAVLFERGSIHMVRNSGEKEMKVACFFAPPSKLEQYEFHPEVSFDSGVEAERK